MKLPWISRINQSNGKWTTVPNRFGITQVPLFGENKAREIAHKISNTFWKIQPKPWLSYSKIQKPNCLKKILATPMWHKPVLKIQYRNERNNEGINLIGDIIDTKLKLWPRDSFKQIKEVEINFIEYESLRRGVVQCLSDINTNKTQGECPRRPAYMDYLGFVKLFMKIYISQEITY